MPDLPATSTPRLALRGVSVQYPGEPEPVLRNLDLSVEAGEFLVLLGDSGCGKTTTLELINRLRTPSAGSIELDGVPIDSLPPTDLRRQIGYAFQGVGLFPHWTVAQNIAVVPELLGWANDRIAARTAELLERVRLPAAMRDRFPHELSGGQRQRVGFARALAAEPRIVLLDEPFGALDPRTRSELQAELAEWHRALDLTVVMVTHDVLEAIQLADQIVLLGGGNALFRGSPAELVQSNDPEVRALLQSARAVQSTLEALGEAGGA